MKSVNSRLHEVVEPFYKSVPKPSDYFCAQKFQIQVEWLQAKFVGLNGQLKARDQHSSQLGH